MFSTQCIGRNKLAGLIKEMCQKAGLKGNFTNHSGKVTCATGLFEASVDEQLIMSQTGHRSTAVRCYKHPTADHDVVLSNVLQPPPNRVRDIDVSTMQKSVDDQAEKEKQTPCCIA